MNQTNIDLGFSASCDPIEQGTGGLILREQLFQAVKAALLFRIQDRRVGLFHPALLRPAKYLSLLQVKDSLPLHRFYRLRARPGKIANILEGYFWKFLHQSQHRLLGWGAGTQFSLRLLHRQIQHGDPLHLVSHMAGCRCLQG